MQPSALSLIYAVTAATDPSQLHGLMQSAARSLGFDRALFGMQVVRPHLPTLEHVESGWPEPYRLIYAEREFVQRDPTVAHCMISCDPLWWNESMYDAGSFEIMEESSSFGLRHGLSIAVHQSPQSKSMLSLARDKPVDIESEEGRRAAEGAAVLAHCLHLAVERLKIPELIAVRRPHLTPRELEVLQWAAEGKSSGVIADLLGISVAAVSFHTGNLYRKLNVATRLQAITKAAALGLLDGSSPHGRAV